MVVVQQLTGALRPQFARSLISGAVVGLFSILFYLSYAALIFSGPLAPFLSYGMAATFITGAIGGIVMTWRSSLPFAIGGPDGATSAVTAALVASVAALQVASGNQQNLLNATLVVLALSSALTGLLLCGVGLGHAGRAIRFIPFPVIGGFIGGSGLLMLLGIVQILTGYRLSLVNAEALLATISEEKLLAGLGVAAFLLVGRRYWKSPLAVPAQLLACLVLFYAAVYALGIPVAEVQAEGWTFAAPAIATPAPPWTLDFPQFPWTALPTLAADLLAVMFVSTISVLLNITGIEIKTKHEANLDRELKVLGVANLVSALLGGYVSCLASSRSNMNFALSGRSRLPGVIVSGLCAIALFVRPEYLGYMPKCVLGGLLVTMAYDSIVRWLVGTVRQLARLEYLSLLAIALIIAEWGFLPGVAIGVVFGFGTFALSAGRVSAVKFAFDGSEYRSSLDRGARELALLAAHGPELQGLQLQSYLFFGSANRLYERVKALLAARSECRFLLFDFRLVTGIDSSATHSFAQIKQAADELGTRLVLVNLSPTLEAAFANARFLTGDIRVIPDFDRALEACENDIIAAHSDAGSEAGSLRDWLVEALRSEELADLLVHECRRLEFPAGAIIAAQGAPADSMHFILEGRIGITVKIEDGRSIRVRSLGQHTTIGEMGLITGRPRSATMEAEIASVVYELSADAFERLKADHPPLAQALLTYIIGVMAERLSFASRLIGVLQR